VSLNAILFGATGMVGEGVLHEALGDPAVGSILVLGRRPCQVRHHKVTEILHGDFFDLSGLRDQLCGYNACFFCLGVSSLGKSEEEYRRLTYDLTIDAARTLSESNPDMVFCYVSGAGTDSSEQGRIMWARVKGKTENDLMKLPFKAVYAFRPGYIRPTPGLGNALAIATLVSPLYPLLKRAFPKQVCTLRDLGHSMIRVAGQGYSGRILGSMEITQLGQSDGNRHV